MKWVNIAWMILFADVAITPNLSTGWGVGEVLLVISAVTVSITTIINAWQTRQTHKVVEANTTAGMARDVKLTEIKTLVDGPMAQQLRQIANLLEDKASASGLSADRALAVDARQKSDDKDATAAAAKGDTGERDRRAGEKDGQ